jgi:hypothetical protein
MIEEEVCVVREISEGEGMRAWIEVEDELSARAHMV